MRILEIRTYRASAKMIPVIGTNQTLDGDHERERVGDYLGAFYNAAIAVFTLFPIIVGP